MNLYHVGINSGDENQQEITATRAVTILTRKQNPPIDILINANVIPKLVEFLSRVNKYSRRADYRYFLNYSLTLFQN